MSRSRKGSPRCPEGHGCDWCGGKVSAERRDVRQAHDPSDGEERTAYDVWAENKIDEGMRAYHAEQCDELAELKLEAGGQTLRVHLVPPRDWADILRGEG